MYKATVWGLSLHVLQVVQALSAQPHFLPAPESMPVSQVIDGVHSLNVSSCPGVYFWQIQVQHF